MKSGVPDAIARYHELLTADIAAESQAMLADEQQRRGVYFGDRPLCTALRPRFFSPDQYRYVRVRCALMLSAMSRLLRAALQDAGLRRQFRLTDWEEELVAVGFSRRKAEYVVGLACADIDLDGLALLPDEDVRARLVALRGIGGWTAEWFLARHLARPNAWPAGDLALRKAVAPLDVDAARVRFHPFENLSAHYLLLAQRVP